MPSTDAKPSGARLQLVRVGAKVGGVGLAQVVVLGMLARQVQRAEPRRVQLLFQVKVSERERANSHMFRLTGLCDVLRVSPPKSAASFQGRWLAGMRKSWQTKLVKLISNGQPACLSCPYLSNWHARAGHAWRSDITAPQHLGRWAMPCAEPCLGEEVIDQRIVVPLILARVCVRHLLARPGGNACHRLIWCSTSLS